MSIFPLVTFGLTAFALPALIAVNALVANNQLSLWLRHRGERLHLTWTLWSGLGLAFLVSRCLQHYATGAAMTLFSIRLQYAIALAMMVSLLLVVRQQVMKPPSRRTTVAVGLATVLIGAALFVDDVVETGPVFLRTDLIGQQFLEGRPGHLTAVYMLLLALATTVCLRTISRHGGGISRARRVGILVAIGAVSAAGMNDILMSYGLDTLRLADFASAAIALAVDHVMVHDYHQMVANMEGVVAERTSALRSATASARTAEASFRDLIDATPDGVVVARAGRIVFANSAAARFFDQVDGAALTGRGAIELVQPDDRERAQTALDEVDAQGRASPAQEERYLVNGAAGRVAEVVRVPLLFEGARTVATILRDVTERRMMAEQLQFAERMASLGTLAAGVAHEINNPMSYVLANLEFLSELLVDGIAGPRPTPDAEVAELIAEAGNGARRVVHIVRDLKAFSRRADTDPLAPIALEQVLDTASEMALAQIRQRARLEREYAGATMVLGNQVRLGQVFVNLVVNAAQAIPEGQQTGSHRIVLRTYVDGAGHPVAEVEDSGAGIDPTVRSRIFDPFFTTKPVGVGTGLGLSSALGIISSLGGTIDADARAGGGTIMRVRFPRMAEAVA